MKQHLADYIRVYNILDADLCDGVISTLENTNWTRHKFYHSDGLVDHGSEPDECHDVIEQTPILQQAVWEALRRYVLEDINCPWFAGWHGFSNIKFIRYNVDTEMENHCDHIHSLYDGTYNGIPILSVIGLLNDDYQGGELVMFEDQVIPLTKGDIVIFPSVFLYPHRITKVTSGIRHSFVSWAH